MEGVEEGADGCIWIFAIGTEVDVAVDSTCDRATICEPRGFHGCRLSLNTILLRVGEQGDGRGCQEYVIWSIVGDDTVVIVKLQIAETELGGAPM